MTTHQVVVLMTMQSVEILCVSVFRHLLILMAYVKLVSDFVSPQADFSNTISITLTKLICINSKTDDNYLNIQFWRPVISVSCNLLIYFKIVSNEIRNCDVMSKALDSSLLIILLYLSCFMSIVIVLQIGSQKSSPSGLYWC